MSSLASERERKFLLLKKSFDEAGSEKRERGVGFRKVVGPVGVSRAAQQKGSVDHHQTTPRRGRIVYPNWACASRRHQWPVAQDTGKTRVRRAKVHKIRFSSFVLLQCLLRATAHGTQRQQPRSQLALYTRNTVNRYCHHLQMPDDEINRSIAGL